MNPTYQIQLKQRGGKWAPQCESETYAAAYDAWSRMLRMGRKLRFVRLSNGVRTVLAKYEPPPKAR